MKTLLTLICSFALVSFASAAQQDQDNNSKNRKVKAATVQQPVIKGASTGGNARLKTQGNATTRTAKFHTQGTGTSRTIHDSTINHGGGSLSSVQSTAKGTTFNKTTTFNKNITVNKNFKGQHFNLSNNPSLKYKAVKFNGNYKIAGANKWGAKYVVFQNYHPQWHDQGWWRSRHNRIVFFF